MSDRPIGLQPYERPSGLQLVEVAGGYQIVTRPDLHEWVRRLFHERTTQKLSVQSLETLAVIAYRQPVTALEITEIRGVNTAGVTERAPVLVGVTPPRSTRMLRHMHERIPGVEVDDATFDRMEGLEGDAAKRAGIEIAIDIVRRLRELDGVAGVHLMAPGWEGEAVPEIIAGAGLAPD